MANNLRRTNRLRALLAGLVTGIIFFVVNRVVNVGDIISNTGLVPFYANDVAANIFLPMITGAIVTAAFTTVAHKACRHDTQPLPTAVAVEGIVIGTLATVAWWTTPLVMLGFAHLWLFYITILVGIGINWTIETVFGIYTVAGEYISAAIGGGVLAGVLGMFCAGVAEGLLGQKAKGSRKYRLIGLAVGIAVGIIGGLVWYKEWWMNWFVLD